MAVYRTAQGKLLDMASLAAKHEKTRAVGNLKVNARGDTIDSNNNVVSPATNKVNQHYTNTVGNRTAQPQKRTNSGVVQRNTQQPQRVQAPQQIVEQPILTTAELELNEELVSDIEIENIKKQELEKLAAIQKATEQPKPVETKTQVKSANMAPDSFAPTKTSKQQKQDSKK